MLRKIRLAFATLCFALITLLFLDFTGMLHGWFGWLAKIQFLPAVLALNVGVVLFLVILTLICGRVYCSVICPLGVLQDVMAWIGRKFKKRKKLPYSYSPAISWLRYGMLGIFIIALVAGFSSLAALLAPYSSYGRIANNFFQPLWQWSNNLLAYFAERAGSYAFYETDVWLKSWSTFIIAVATFVVLAVLAGRNGRTYCNTICPVGTVLGFLSRYSFFRIMIEPDKCNECSLCARNCKAACIDIKEHKVDASRCVTCMNCIDKCSHGAISYTTPKKVPKQMNETRRRFFTVTALVAVNSVLKAQKKKGDGGLATIEDKKIPERSTPIVPPGSLGIRHLTQHCTACQLCVSVCPNQVLRPSADLMKLMQPEMAYERG